MRTPLGVRPFVRHGSVVLHGLKAAAGAKSVPGPRGPVRLTVYNGSPAWVHRRRVDRFAPLACVTVEGAAQSDLLTMHEFLELLDVRQLIFDAVLPFLPARYLEELAFVGVDRVVLVVGNHLGRLVVDRLEVQTFEVTLQVLVALLDLVDELLAVGAHLGRCARFNVGHDGVPVHSVQVERLQEPYVLAAGPAAPSLQVGPLEVHLHQVVVVLDDGRVFVMLPLVDPVDHALGSRPDLYRDHTPAKVFLAASPPYNSVSSCRLGPVSGGLRRFTLAQQGRGLGWLLQALLNRKNRVGD